MVVSEEYVGDRCEYDGKKFPHYGAQIALGVTKWFCNEGCYRKWQRGKPEKKETIKI